MRLGEGGQGAGRCAILGCASFAAPASFYGNLDAGSIAISTEIGSFADRRWSEQPADNAILSVSPAPIEHDLATKADATLVTRSYSTGALASVRPRSPSRR